MAITSRTALPTAASRIGILTIEHARISVERNNVVATTASATYSLPTAQLTALLIGPGTTVTHAAAVMLADHAVTVLWTGSGTVRAYSTITPLAVRADLFHRHVTIWSDRQHRLAVARELYAMRFPDDQTVHRMTMPQLRAAEGRRVRDLYRKFADDHDIAWTRRETDWDRSDDINNAITTAYQALYGSALAAIQCLGLHPALGFVHTGKHHAFVYDIADLHKMTTGLTAAFEAITEEANCVERETRTRINEMMRQDRTLPNMITQIHHCLGYEIPDIETLYIDNLELFDLRDPVPARTNYDTEVVNLPF